MDLIRGDWRFFWPESISSFANAPQAWDSSLNTGIGIQSINTMWITSYLNLSAFISSLGLGWIWTSVLLWIIPIVVLSFIGSVKLFNLLFPDNRYFGLFSGLIYTTNSYFLLIFIGGQLGVAFAYSILPLVLVFGYKMLGNTSVRNSILFGLIASLQILFDPRIFVLSLLSLGIFFIYLRKVKARELIKSLIIAGLVILLTHCYWILPLVLFPNTSGLVAISQSKVSFFSFALLENTISLLHPNWPENIFGKVYFLKPEYLILPILAFIPLFFINTLKSMRRGILAIVMIGLVGIFFAKGTNEPFGFVYQMLYDYIPGFSIFRDPTKFYMLIAVSYSLLIPLGLKMIAKSVAKKYSFKFLTLRNLCVLFIVYWIILNRFVFSHSILPTPQQVPTEYKQLEEFISSQKDSFRTVWIPQWQRFGYFSNYHPAIGRGEIFTQNTPEGILNELPLLNEKLDFLSVKYVIVPLDSESEIFLEDHKYSDQKYIATSKNIENISYLKKVKNFGKIVIYENVDYKKRIYSLSGSDIIFNQKSPTRYTIYNKDGKNSQVIFSENYSPYWNIDLGDKKVWSQNYEGLNSFVVPEGTKELDLRFEPQGLVYISLIISVLSVLSCATYVLYKKS